MSVVGVFVSPATRRDTAFAAGVPANGRRGASDRIASTGYRGSRRLRSAVSLYVFSQQFADAARSIAVVAVATVAVVSVILGASLATGASLDAGPAEP